MGVARFVDNASGVIPDPVAWNSDGSQNLTSIVGPAPGTIVWGDNGSAFLYCTFVGDGNTHYQGEIFQFGSTTNGTDQAFVASVLEATPGATDTTFTSMQVGSLFLGVQTKLSGPSVGVQTNNQGYAFTSGTTYSIWLQVAGKSMLAFDGKPVGLVFTSATAGEFGHATATKAYSFRGVRANFGTITFSGTTVNTSTTISVASGTDYDDLLFPGVALSGTGVGSNARIVTVTGSKTSGYTIVVSVASTASGTVTITPSILYIGLLNFPEVTTQAA